MKAHQTKTPGIQTPSANQSSSDRISSHENQWTQTLNRVTKSLAKLNKEDGAQKIDETSGSMRKITSVTQ